MPIINPSGTASGSWMNDDESQDYKLQVRERTKLRVATERFVAEFHAWKQDPTNISSLPSLIDAYTEIQRIL